MKKQNTNYVSEFSDAWHKAIQSLEPSPEELMETNLRMKHAYEMAIDLIERSKFNSLDRCSKALNILEIHFKGYACLANIESYRVADPTELRIQHMLKSVRETLVDALRLLVLAGEDEDMVHRVGYFASETGQLPIDQYSFISDEKTWTISLIAQISVLLQMNDDDLIRHLQIVGANRLMTNKDWYTK